MDELKDKDINVAIAERLFHWRWYSVHPRTLDCNAIDYTQRVKMLAMTENTPGLELIYREKRPFQSTILLRENGVREGFGASMKPELLEERDWNKYPKYGEEPNHIKDYYIESYSHKYEGFTWDYFIPDYINGYTQVLEEISKKEYFVKISYQQDSDSFCAHIFKNESPSIFHRRLGISEFSALDKDLGKAVCLAAMQLDFRGLAI